MVVAKEVVILDGSTGDLLVRQHGLPEDALFKCIWSSAALLRQDFHSKIMEIHKSYMEAGAEIVSTNSYAIQPYYYRRGESLIRKMLKGQGEGESGAPPTLEQIMSDHAKLSAELAVKARDEFLAEADPHKGSISIKVFGSVGPICESHRPEMYDEFLAAEGSTRVTQHFKTIAESLLEGGCDGLILDTMNSWSEARHALDGVAQAKGAQRVPIIVSLQGALFDKDDNQTAKSAEKAPLMAMECLAYKRKSGLNIVGLGFNCVGPEVVLEGLRSIKGHQVCNDLKEESIGLAAYSNILDMSPYTATGGYQTDDSILEINLKRRSESVDFVKDFVEAGASYVGGCCGSNPQDISNIKKLLTGN